MQILSLQDKSNTFRNYTQFLMCTSSEVLEWHPLHCGTQPNAVSYSPKQKHHTMFLWKSDMNTNVHKHCALIVCQAVMQCSHIFYICFSRFSNSVDSFWSTCLCGDRREGITSVEWERGNSATPNSCLQSQSWQLLACKRCIMRQSSGDVCCWF